ncbi:MAG TPA: MlaD family protein [Thermoleophilaceae bacterium]|jgi:ABC-type transporter Mla subunit MlaD
MRRLAASGLVIGACLLALVLSGASNETKKGLHFKIQFDNAFGLAEGGDLKIAGVRAGKTPSFDITGGPRPKAVVDAEITQPGMADLRKDASCDIRPQSFIGEYYVDCKPGSSKQKLQSGDTIGVKHTTSTIPADLVADILRLPYRERFRLIISELGAGLAGRPQDLSAVLRRADPGLRETTKTLAILGRQTATIERFIGNSDTVLAALAHRKTEVSRFVHEARNTAEITATRRNELARTFNRLPAFLSELRPYMSRLGDLTEAQTPLLRDLRGASGDLDTFLRRLGPFSEAARPALQRLGRASEVGTRAVKLTNKDVVELRRLAQIVPGLAKPLRQFLTSLDDRTRAVEPDPRAAATGPPAGDKTHIPSGTKGGFTGMEGLWDYFYWQALSTNPLDKSGHVLRLTALVNQCSPYQVKRTGQEALIDSCNQWLGPYQPGINAPDPTEIPGEAGGASKARTPRLTRPARLERKRAAAPPRGTPTTPAPSSGRRAPALPQAVQKLLDPVTGPRPAPRTPPRVDVPLLDYLLSP